MNYLNLHLNLYIFFLVSLFGGLGSVMRFVIGHIIVRKFFLVLSTKDTASFAYDTLIVNISGCFLIGFLGPLIYHNYHNNYILDAAFLVGFCGGLTTFSKFMFDAVLMLEKKYYLKLFCYICMTILLSIAFYLLGKSLVNIIL